MKKILTYGTFDLFHYGHLEILRRSKDLGDHLTVGVSSDEFNIQKEKKSFYNTFHRISIVKSIKYVDEVITEFNWEQKKHDIIQYSIDVLVMGDDWIGKFDYLNDLCDVKYLSRTKNISTSFYKKILNS